MAGVVSKLKKIPVGDAGEEKFMKPTTKDEFYTHCGFESIY